MGEASPACLAALGMQHQDRLPVPVAATRAGGEPAILWKPFSFSGGENFPTADSVNYANARRVLSKHLSSNHLPEDTEVRRTARTVAGSLQRTRTVWGAKPTLGSDALHKTL